MNIRNFLFHRVSLQPDPLWPPMQPDLFEKIIRYLTGNFGVILLEDYLKDPSRYKQEKNMATVCFDDGYLDNLEVAAPILKRYRCPASFYVVTDCIDQNLPTWTYITDHVFQQESNHILLDGDFIRQEFRDMYWNSKEEGIAWGKQVKPWMKSLPNHQRKAVMGSILEQHRGKELPRNMMMNWSQVKELDNAGFYVASHSHTHPMLASLQNEKEIMDEMIISADILEKKLGHRPLTISYPIGSYDDRVITAARQAGYKYGLAVEQRFYNTELENEFAIPRVELYQEPWWKSRMRISGLYQTVKKLVR